MPNTNMTLAVNILNSLITSHSSIKMINITEMEEKGSIKDNARKTSYSAQLCKHSYAESSGTMRHMGNRKSDICKYNNQTQNQGTLVTMRSGTDFVLTMTPTHSSCGQGINR